MARRTKVRVLQEAVRLQRVRVPQEVTRALPEVMEVPVPETGVPPREVTAATALQAVMVQAVHLPMRMMIRI